MQFLSVDHFFIAVCIFTYIDFLLIIIIKILYIYDFAFIYPFFFNFSIEEDKYKIRR